MECGEYNCFQNLYILSIQKYFKWQHTKLNISNENSGHSVNVLDVTQYVPIDEQIDLLISAQKSIMRQDAKHFRDTKNIETIA